MPRQAIENEVQEFLQAHASVGASQDRQAVVGNGSLPARKILTGLGALQARQPRVRDLRETGKVVLTSHILPRCMRRVPSSDALIPALLPALYPHGISTGDFTEALAAIPGPKAAGFVRQQYRRA